MPRLSDFVANIVRSGLIDRSALDPVVASLPPEPEADAAVRLARSLIQRELLTHYQARKLLAGATIGFFLGGYKILRPLGEGGMGKVYLAENTSTRERVAIKVLPPRKAAEEEQALLRFRREMELSQKVTHPNLARTLGVGEESGVHFMILEYIPGESLFQAVKEPGGGPMRVADVARLFLKVIDGLEAAHDAGLVHRDVKPSNIMITPDGDAKVLDLGLARAVEEDRPLTRPNIVVGTLDYVSPEQIVNASGADRRSDLYSLGCTLYFALAGRPPFEGGDMVNKIVKQRMDDPEPLEKVARGVPASFSAIVKKLMAKNPDERYQDCGELRIDLARWTDPERVRALVGAEATAARAFHLPPPLLDEMDLRLIPDDAVSTPALLIRDLGDAAPSAAPRRRPTPTPTQAVVRPAVPETTDDARWLTQLIAVALVVGLLAILIITLLF
ncbi:MAG: serine/threonine-protein kinase [Isosphaeraceae bacterium]